MATDPNPKAAKPVPTLKPIKYPTTPITPVKTINEIPTPLIQSTFGYLSYTPSDKILLLILIIKDTANVAIAP